MLKGKREGEREGVIARPPRGQKSRKDKNKMEL